MGLSRLNIFASVIFTSVILAAILAAPAWAARTALPGTLNYVEGNASIGAQSLNAKSIGSAELQPGQSLTTEDGRAEILLTPGVFLRVGQHSAVRMISQSLINTRVGVEKGEAMVEVAELHKGNDLRVMEDGADTQLVKTGLYDFNADQNVIRVFDGQAMAQEGNRRIKVKGGRELMLNTARPAKAEKFNKDEYKQSDLYRWSSLRSSYLAEANQNAAQTYVANGWYGPRWFGAGWYWDPWFDTYTFIPGAGLLYSPFGWGFYSPLWVYRAPLFYGGGRHFHHFGPEYHPRYEYHGHFSPHGPRHFRGPEPERGFHGRFMGRPAHLMDGRGFGGFHGHHGRRH